MEINIGADELILWIRKNKKNLNIPNDGINGLGQIIYQIIIDLGGTKVNADSKSFWDSSSNSENIGEYLLPKTSAQYSIDICKISDVYKKLINLQTIR